MEPDTHRMQPPRRITTRQLAYQLNQKKNVSLWHKRLRVYLDCCRYECELDVDFLSGALTTVCSVPEFSDGAAGAESSPDIICQLSSAFQLNIYIPEKQL